MDYEFIAYWRRCDFVHGLLFIFSMILTLLNFVFIEDVNLWGALPRNVTKIETHEF